MSINNTPPSSDKRLFKRIQFDSPIAIEQGNSHWISHIVDISLKGLLLADSEARVDHQQLIALDIPLSSEAHIKMLARWDHSKDGFTGLHWEKVDIESMTHLRRLLELNCGDSELLTRELLQLNIH